MTKLEFESLVPAKMVAMRYQYMGRKQVQTGSRSVLVDNKILLHGIGFVSYKSVDLVK